MALVKRFGPFRGTDTRKNKLHVDPDHFSDSKNIVIRHADGSEIIEKRNGYDHKANSAGTDGIVSYGDGSELIISDTVLKKYSGGSITTINGYLTYGSATTGVNDFVEKDGVLYVAKPSGYVGKYDGVSWYAVDGSPGGIENFVSSNLGGSLSPSTTYEYYVDIERIDANENIAKTRGGYNAGFVSSGDNTLDFDIRNNGSQEVQGTHFNNAFGTMSSTGTTSADPAVISVTAGHDIQVGQWVFMPNGTIFTGVTHTPFKVIATTSTTVSLDNPASLTIYHNNNDYISSYLAYIYRKDSGIYKKLGEVCIPASGVKTVRDDGTASLGVEAIEPDYTSSIPPRSKYIAYWKDQLFLAGVEEREKIVNSSKYTWNSYPNRLKFSSTDGLDTYEVFREGTDSIEIGDDSEGPITGLAASNDTLIVFKKRAIYFVSGNIISGSFRVDKAHSSCIGCVSHDSIQEIDGYIVFLSEQGVYRVRGGGFPELISSTLYPTLNDSALTKTLATSTHDCINQRYILHIPHSSDDLTLVWDYFRDGWFIWRDLDIKGGQAIHNNTHYILDSSSRILEERSAKADDLTGAGDTAIDAYIESEWENFGDPSLGAKVINVKMFALENSTYTMTMNTYKDWDDSTAITSVTADFTSTNLFEKKKVTAGKNKNYAFKVKFSNNVVNENMELNGWELEVEPTMGKIKE